MEKSAGEFALLLFPTEKDASVRLAQGYMAEWKGSVKERE